MKKKILSLILAGLMAFSSAAIVAADSTETSEKSPYYWAVDFLCKYGIYKGQSAGNLAIDKDIERYQMALFVSRISTGWVDDATWEDGPLNTSIFTDVETSATAKKYLGAISYANQKGIIEGYGDGKFGPHDGITYQDALTMVVRTLGYTGLDWPWGYIEQAVELGLTQDLENVGYTDILNRGQVAQIIYRALFAPINGTVDTTLAMTKFDVEFGWEPIVIVASNGDVYEATNAGVTFPDDKWVAFKIYNEDGSLEDGLYYALASELGLDVAKHQDELAVGKAYWVLLEKEVGDNSNFVKIVDYSTTQLGDILENRGNDKEEAINAYLGSYNIVTAYTPKNYINDTKLHKNEIMLYNAIATGATAVWVGDSQLEIDWVSGDLTNKATGEKWFWNDVVGNYFKNKTNADGLVIGQVWMTEADFAALYEASKIHVQTLRGFNTPVGAYTAHVYADLYVEDIDGDGDADRGIFEDYEFAYLSAAQACNVCGGAHYTITRLQNALGLNGTAIAGTEAVCGAWFAEGYAPTGAGHVLLSVDRDSKEIKVIKEIENGDDEDSGVVKGVLRGYSPAKGEIIVGDEKYTTKYDNLVGSGFRSTGAAANILNFTAGFDSMLNQFVQLIIVDGQVVRMDLVGHTVGEYLVVKQYVGLSNDDYIAVDAYSTATGALSTYYIGSYNGWKQGDYYYYLTAEKAQEAFSAGAIYHVQSYDADNNVHYVELVGEFERTINPDDGILGNVGNILIGDYVVDGSKVSLSAPQTISFAIDGYRTIDGAVSKMTDNDLYIILADDADTATWKAPIYVFKGKVANPAWFVTGQRITTIGNATVMVNVTDMNGFDLDTYQSGMYLYEGGKVLEANYDGAFEKVDGGRYIVGATTFKVEMLNLYTGQRNAQIVDKNVSLEAGHIYISVSDRIVEEWSPLADGEISLWDTNSFIAVMARIYYRDRDLDARFVDTADYLFGYFKQPVGAAINANRMNEVLAAPSTSTDIFRFNGEGAPFTAGGWYQFNRARVSSVVTYYVTYTGDLMSVSTTAPTGIDTFECAYVAKVNADGTVSVVVYAKPATRQWTTALANGTETIATDINGTAADLMMTVTGTSTFDNYTVPGLDGTTEHLSTTVNSVTFYYTGADLMRHNDRAVAGLGFGHKSQHALGSYFDGSSAKLSYKGNVIVDLYNNANAANITYTTYACEDDMCDIVCAITITGLNIVVPAGDFGDLVLDLTINPAFVDGDVDSYEAATWSIGSTLASDTTGFDMTAVATTVNENSFLAWNPDAAQGVIQGIID